MTFVRHTTAVLAVTATLTAFPALAEYPEQPITMIVPFSAGGGTDASARTIAQFMERELDSPVVVVNRPGAAGEIGLAEIAGAEPDGYTIGIINTPGIVTIPIERDARFAMDDFTFIAGMVEDPGTINVLGESEIDTVEDLVVAAEENPGCVTVGTQGVGSAGHISMLLFERAAGIDLLPIPFDGAATARNALLAGEIQASTANLGEAMTFAQGTDWTILGVMSDARSEMEPRLPTFEEAGYRVIGGSLRGIGVPAGLPEKVLARLSDTIEAVASDPEYLEVAANTFQPVRFVPSDEYTALLRGLQGEFEELWDETPWNQ